MDQQTAAGSATRHLVPLVDPVLRNTDLARNLLTRDHTRNRVSRQSHAHHDPKPRQSPRLRAPSPRQATCSDSATIRLRRRHNPSRALLRRTDARHVIAPSSARLSPPDAAAILPTMTYWSVIVGGALVALAIIVMLTLLLHGAPPLG